MAAVCSVESPRPDRFTTHPRHEPVHAVKQSVHRLFLATAKQRFGVQHIGETIRRDDSRSPVSWEARVDQRPLASQHVRSRRPARHPSFLDVLL